jgi:hypothetical protein
VEVEVEVSSSTTVTTGDGTTVTSTTATASASASILGGSEAAKPERSTTVADALVWIDLEMTGEPGPCSRLRRLAWHRALAASSQQRGASRTTLRGSPRASRRLASGSPPSAPCRPSPSPPRPRAGA